MNNLKNLIRSYETWVAANPETVCDLETTTKWVSYFIAGRISDSNVVSELIYSLSNILQFYNDRIIDKSRSLSKKKTAGITFSTTSTTAIATTAENSNTRTVYRLKVILTTLEYCEVFIEISANRLFGNRGKWLFIVFLQTFKAAGRLFILNHSTEQIITTPSIPTLNRRSLIKEQKLAIKNANPLLEDEHSFTFQLKRSGRVVRKVEGAPPLHYRDFNMSAFVDTNKQLQQQQRGIIKTTPILSKAEYIYIAKPLVHLAAMGLFGQKRWKQYIVALTMDLMSIRLYHQNRHLMTKEQKVELSRRVINLLLYLMRSPFYDNFTKSRVDRLLGFVAENIPLIRMIAGPLKDYVPHWQNIYYYMWST